MMTRVNSGWYTIVVVAVCLSATTAQADGVSRARLNDIVSDAFGTAHDGFSSDEVVLDPKLNQPFIAACRESLPDVAEFDFNWTLLNLRKAGKLRVKSTRRRHTRHDEYLHAAEIAARFMHDKHKVSMDRVVCDPKLRAEFDKVARGVAPKVDLYRLRKAAFGLRKARRLRPELVVRVADWGTTVTSHPASQIVDRPILVPASPGIYVIRDKTGYLYIGESSDLRSRVAKHLDHSDRKSLAHYLWQNGNKEITVELHVFDADSNGRLKSMRRAYESELIRSRKPRLNIAP